jgi:outer membrane receptor protein involved in Fe transport
MRAAQTSSLAIACLLLGPGLLAAQADALDSLLATRISSAAKYEQTISEVAGAVTIVTADDIARFGYRTVAEVLAVTRGFYVSNDRNYTYIGTRGFSRPSDYNNRILILVNGQTINEPIWGGGYIAKELGIDLSAVERIEIIRGPGSAVYGNGAVFGVVNVVMKSGGMIDGASIAALGGSLQTRGASARYGRRFTSGLEVNGFATWEDANGRDLYVAEYDVPGVGDGMARGADWEKNWGVGGGVRKGPFTASAVLYSRRKSIPTGAFETVFGDDRSWTADRTALAQIGYEQDLGRGLSLRGRTYFAGYWYEGDYYYGADYPTSFEAAGAEGAGAEAVLTWDLGSANRLTAGAEFRYNWRAEYFGPRSGPRDFEVNEPHTVPSLYLQDELQLTRTLSVLAGVRYDEYDESGSAINPRGALIFTPSRATSIKLLYGRAYRAPAIAEREASGYSVPAPDLHEERAATLELIYQQRLGRGLLGTISAFDYTIDGLIDPVDGSDLTTFANVSDAHARGLEVGLDGRFGSMSGYASYTLQRAHDEATDIVLTNSPRHVVKAGVATRLPGGLRPALEGRYESGRRTVADTWTDDFFLADVNLGFTPPVSARSPLSRVELSVRARNLFNVKYGTPGGIEHLQSAIVQDGRTVLAELRYRF